MLLFDHIGYAVENIEQYLEFFVPLFEPRVVGSPIEDSLQQVRVLFVEMEGGLRIELIQPTTATSPARVMLNQRQGGWYQVCYAVNNVERELNRFRASGCIKISGPTPAIAFDGRRIAFLFTPQRDVIELVEQSSLRGV